MDQPPTPPLAELALPVCTSDIGGKPSSRRDASTPTPPFIVASVLQIDPTNKTVIEALKQLNQRGAGSRAPRGNNANPAPQPEPNLDLGQPGSELPPPR